MPKALSEIHLLFFFFNILIFWIFFPHYQDNSILNTLVLVVTGHPNKRYLKVTKISNYIFVLPEYEDSTSYLIA